MLGRFLCRLHGGLLIRGSGLKLGRVIGGGRGREDGEDVGRVGRGGGPRLRAGWGKLWREGLGEVKVGVVEGRHADD